MLRQRLGKDVVVKSLRLGIKVRGKAREREERYSPGQVFLEAKEYSAESFFPYLLGMSC